MKLALRRGTHRFQSAVSEKDEVIGTRLGCASSQVQVRLIPIKRSFAETARWKRCVPRARLPIQIMRPGVVGKKGDPMPAGMTAVEFIKKLKTYRSPEELKKIQRYFKT